MKIFIKNIILGLIVFMSIQGFAQQRALLHSKDSIINVINQTDDINLLAEQYHQLSKVYLKLGDDEGFIESNNKAKDCAYSSENNDVLLESNILAALYHKSKGDAVEAVKNYVAARKSLGNNPDNEKDADLCQEIGLIYFNRGHYERATESFEESVSKYQKAKKYPKEMVSKGYLAYCYYMGDSTKFQKADKVYSELLEYHKQNNDFNSQRIVYNRLADLKFKQKKYIEALDLYNDLFDACNSAKDMEGQINALNNKAYTLVLLKDFPQAIATYQQVEHLDKISGEKCDALAATYTNLGICYQNNGDYKESVRYLEMAADQHKKCQDSDNYSRVKNMIALIYLKNKDIYNAKLCSEQAYQAAESSSNPQVLADAYLTHSDVLEAWGDGQISKEYYKKYWQVVNQMDVDNILSQRQKNEDLKKLTEAEQQSYDQVAARKFEVLADKQQKLIADQLRLQNEQLKKNQEIQELEKNRALQKLALSKKEQEATLARQQAEAIQHENDLQAAALRQKEAEERQRQMEIENLNAQRKAQDLQLQAGQAEKQKIVLAASLLGVIVLGMIFVLLLVRKKNQKLNEQQEAIELQNADLMQKNEEITVQKENLLSANSEIMAINEELTRQKEVIEQKNKSITDSILYAKRIQQAICYLPDFLKEMNIDYFLFFRPKDIVSGDYFWFHKTDKHLFAVAADCTGHGVPGAFMSMLGISLLNKIVKENHEYEPANILNQMREGVCQSLHQNSINDAEAKDGMDMTLFRLNPESGHFVIASADNAAWVVQKFKPEDADVAFATMDSKYDSITATEDGIIKIHTFKADKMPIGIYAKMDPFGQQEMYLNHGDTIYMSSDGYIDQFGGKSGRKFLKSNFVKLIETINPIEDMNERKNIIAKTHDEWLGSTYHQTDDIIVLGVRY